MTDDQHHQISKEDLLQCLFTSMPAQLVVKDLNGRCIFQNRKASEEGGPSVNQDGSPVTFPLKDAQETVIGSCEMVMEDPCLPEANTAKEAEAAQQSHPTWDFHCTSSSSDSSSNFSSDDMYHEMIQNIQTGVSVFEVLTDDTTGEPIDFELCEANPAFEHFLGVNAQECIGKRFTEIFPGIQNDYANWVQLFGNVGLTGENKKFIRYSETLKNWYSGVAYQTQPGRCAVLFMETSEQEELMASKRRLQESLAISKIGQWDLDLTTNSLQWSAGVYRLFQMDPNEFGASYEAFLDAIHPEDRDMVDAAYREHLETKEPYEIIHRLLLPDQPVKWVMESCRSEYDRQGTPLRSIGTVQDITELKQVQEDLRLAKEKAEEADQLKSAFLANMSHEIRTPLNGIMGHIELALSNGLSEEWREENLEGLHVAKTSGSLLLAIIQDILDLSKIEAGQLVVQKDEAFSLNGTMVQTKSLAETIIKSRRKRIGFSCNLEKAKDCVLGDPFRLQQVINNLISNAIKFTESGGQVKMMVELKDSETLQFSVLDTGKGIPPTHLETIFEPFRQVEISDTRQHGGTGLGLTISRRLVNMMGGKMRVESSTVGPIRGSFFSFTLPYRPALSGGLHSPRRSPLAMPSSCRSEYGKENNFRNLQTTNSPPKDDFDRHNFKILIAEDDPVSRKMVSRMLQRTGYGVSLACNGQEAVTACNHDHDVSLVLMDVQMPILDGHEATRRIRESEESHGDNPVPIIALSAGAMKTEKEQGLAFGVTDYMTKPVNFQCLVQTLDKYLRRANPVARKVK